MYLVRNTLHSFAPEKHAKYSWKALLIFLAGLALTVLLTFNVYHNVDKIAQEEFETLCKEIEHKISARLHAHALILRAGSAYFSVSDTVTREDWKIFIERSKIEKNLPGILGVGFSLLIPADQLDNHIRHIRSEGFPKYSVYPAGKRSIYTSIIYLEPFSGRNLKAFGYDMFTEPVRRKVMELARDHDLAMLSGKVGLVQENKEDIQSGSLMYVPFYKSGLPVNTIDQRRAAIRGWVYSPYRMNDLMQGILGHWDGNQRNMVHLKVFDDSIANNSLLYDSYGIDSATHANVYRTLTLPVVFNGKKWVLFFSQYSEPIFYFHGRVLIVLLSGVIISILLFLLAMSFFNLFYTSRLIKKQNSELQSLNAQKDKFFSIIAHDLKSPFNSIVGFSDLLLERVRDKDYEGIGKYAAIIQSSSERAMNLLKNLMDWSRSQTGRMEFDPEFFEMNNLINETIDLFTDIAGQKSITIKTSLPPILPLFADKAMISTVMRNLISNAIKFTSHNGEIIISATEQQEGFKVSVADDGVGMSKTSLNKLFRLDENFSTPGTNKEQGTGLGLILCKEFIEKHGGKIWVESEEGKGSKFSFWISKA